MPTQNLASTVRDRANAFNKRTGILTLKGSMFIENIIHMINSTPSGSYILIFFSIFYKHIIPEYSVETALPYFGLDQRPHSIPSLGARGLSLQKLLVPRTSLPVGHLLVQTSSIESIRRPNETRREDAVRQTTATVHSRASGDFLGVLANPSTSFNCSASSRCSNRSWYTFRNH